MINAFIYGATVLYVGQGALYYWNGNTAQAVVMAGYVLANIGLILSVR